jgi:hypothetical protein
LRGFDATRRAGAGRSPGADRAGPRPYRAFLARPDNQIAFRFLSIIAVKAPWERALESMEAMLSPPVIFLHSQDKGLLKINTFRSPGMKGFGEIGRTLAFDRRTLFGAEEGM